MTTLKLISKYIVNIFHVSVQDLLSQASDSFLEIVFEYKDFLICIRKYEDRDKRVCQSIEIQPNKNDFYYTATDFPLLLAYYDHESFNMKFNVSVIHASLIKLKYYIDNNMIFYEYHTLDLSKRFFYIDNQTKKMPLLMDLSKESYLRFGEKANQIENTDVYYR